MKKTYESPEFEVSNFSLKNVLVSSFPDESEVPIITNPNEPTQPDITRPRP